MRCVLALILLAFAAGTTAAQDCPPGATLDAQQTCTMERDGVLIVSPAEMPMGRPIGGDSVQVPIRLFLEEVIYVQNGEERHAAGYFYEWEHAAGAAFYHVSGYYSNGPQVMDDSRANAQTFEATASFPKTIQAAPGHLIGRATSLSSPLPASEPERSRTMQTNRDLAREFTRPETHPWVMYASGFDAFDAEVVFSRDTVTVGDTFEAYVITRHRRRGTIDDVRPSVPLALSGDGELKIDAGPVPDVLASVAQAIPDTLVYTLVAEKEGIVTASSSLLGMYSRYYPDELTSRSRCGEPGRSACRVVVKPGGLAFTTESAFMDADSLFWPDTTYTLRWTNDGATTVEIHASLLRDPDPENDTHWPIVVGTGLDADAGMFAWKVPQMAVSPSVRLRLRNEDDATVYHVSERSRVRYGWALYRTAQHSERDVYESFVPNLHGWSYANSPDVWFPEAWYANPAFDYPDGGRDPRTQAPYPDLFRAPSIAAQSQYYPDWPSWGNAFTSTYTSDGAGMSVQTPFHVELWASKVSAYYKGNFEGACFGMATAALLTFADPGWAATLEPGFEATRQLFTVTTPPTPGDAFAPYRRVVNALYARQYSTLREDGRSKASSSGAAELATIQAALLTDDPADDVVLSFCQTKPSLFRRTVTACHAVAPYRVVKPLFGDGLAINVSDPNLPGGSNSLIVASDGKWSFPAYGWNGFQYANFISTQQAQQFRNAVAFSESSPRRRSDSGDNRLFVTASSDVLITDAEGRSVGSVDGEGFSDFDPSEGIPILIPTGGPSSPVGYSIPSGAYRVEAEVESGGAHLTVERPDGQTLFYSRLSAVSGEQDVLAYDTEAGLTATNPSSLSRVVGLGLLNPTGQRVALIERMALGASNSVTVASTNDSVRLTNHGGGTRYDLRVYDTVGDKTGAFIGAGVELAAGSIHTLHPQWGDLEDGPLSVDVDNNGDGTPDRTITVRNDRPTAGAEGSQGARQTALAFPYPNPATSRTTIPFSIPEAGPVRLSVLDALGREVLILEDGVRSAGDLEVAFDTGRLSPGVYVVRLEAGGEVASRTLTVVR